MTAGLAEATGRERVGPRPLLQELTTEVGGVRGAVLATRDGRALAHSLAADEVVAADASSLVADLLVVSTRVAALDGAGPLEAIIRTTRGCVVVQTVADVAVLVVLAEPDVNLATLRLGVRRRVEPMVAAAREALVTPAVRRRLGRPTA